MPTYWNTRPDNIKKQANYVIFKMDMKKHIVEKENMKVNAAQGELVNENNENLENDD